MYDTPLLQKLGVTHDRVNLLINAPLDYLALFDEQNINGLRIHSEDFGFIEKSFDSDDSSDFIHFFIKDKTELEKLFPKLKKYLKSDGMIWVSWPKKSSHVESDLNENIVRKIGLEVGLVDVKVVSIDEIWSGLKFVYRVKDRD